MNQPIAQTHRPEPGTRSSASDAAPLKFVPNSLQWRIPGMIGLLVGITMAISFAVIGSEEAAAAQIFLASASAALIAAAACFLALKSIIAPLRQATEFVRTLPAYHTNPLEMDHAAFEITALKEAINSTVLKLSAHDSVLNEAFNELQEQQYAFDHHAIVSIVDFNGHLQYANDLLCEMTGYARHELLGSPFTLLSPDDDPLESNTELWRKLLQGDIWRGEMRIKSKQGKTHWLESSYVPIRDIQGQPHHFICIQTDITERKRSTQDLAANQKALEMLTGSLEQLIKDRTAELEKSNEELVSANQVKSEFISIVSHELRTPLTSIKSFADILNDEIDDPECKNYLRIINDEADRLNRLINDILDMQKIDAGRMVWRDEAINLVDVTRSAVESFSGAYRAKGISLELAISDSALYAVTDSDKIRQVFANLMSNALKFTSEGSVTVNVSRICKPDGKKFVQLSVADSGPGLAASQLTRVFEQFYQVENDQSRKIQGTGLGLTICKQIIEHYQGNIWAESELGKGTTILFTLPETHPSGAN